MFKWLKKQKYKIAISLCFILSIFTLFLGINKTYAYDTNQFSYTISNVRALNNNYSHAFTITHNGPLIDLQCTLNNQINVPYNYVLLVNFNLTRVDEVSIYSDSSITNSISFGSNSFNFASYYNSRTHINNTHYCLVYNAPRENADSFNTFNLRIRYNSNNIDRDYIFNLINIDFVNKNDIGLSQYYETYYGQIEDNYNALLSDYNDLQDSYDMLESNYDTLQDNYDTLEDNYTNLNTNYENYYNSMYMGNFANLKNINWYNNNYDITITQEELLNNEYYYFDFAEWDIYNYFMNYEWEENNLPTGTIEIDFNFNNTNLNLLNIQLSNTNQYLTTYQIFLKDSSNTIKIINLPLADNYAITLTYLQSLVNYSLDNHYFYMLKIYNYLYGSEIPNDQKTNIKATITYDSYYYQYGYNNGVNSQQGKIEEKNNKIATLEHEKEVLNEVLATNNARYWDLVERYNNLANDPNSLYGMVISVADVPLHVFQQIFNFDVLGINISALVMSIISLLVIIWLIKKLI